MRLSWRNDKNRSCKLARATSLELTICGDSPLEPCTVDAKGAWGSGFGNSTSKLLVRCPAQQRGQGVGGGGQVEGVIRGVGGKVVNRGCELKLREFKV